MGHNARQVSFMRNTLSEASLYLSLALSNHSVLWCCHTQTAHHLLKLNASYVKLYEEEHASKGHRGNKTPNIILRFVYSVVTEHCLV